MYIMLAISIIQYIYNLTYFIILLHYSITNIYMRVFLIVCVYSYVCFKGCHVIRKQILTFNVYNILAKNIK